MPGAPAGVFWAIGLGNQIVQVDRYGERLGRRVKLSLAVEGDVDATIEALLPMLGRERETARLRALLRDPSVRLVTIIGPGGVGKTRLALEMAIAQRVPGAGLVVGYEFFALVLLTHASLSRLLGPRGVDWKGRRYA